jgi:threonylcarbamoyladenosine tRNA methylthiotransferase MtaB
VTASADQGTRQTIRRVARENPSVKVIVTGCYASRCPDDVAALPNVVRVISNESKDDVATFVAGELTELTTVDRFSGGDGPCGFALHPGIAGRTAFTLRVQTGCDEQCSYCIIPTTRGRGRSRPMASVMADLRKAVDAGYKEIAITGVHLGSYGRDLGDGSTLEALVRVLADWPDDVLFRISSLEPMDCTPEIVRIAAISPRIAPHFHLPLQHGSNRMLRAMRRPYTADGYRRLLDGIHASTPEASVGTDAIVGFPGETDADHEATLSLLRALPLSHVHVFPYSDRPGTAAAVLADKVDGTVIRTRARELREAGARLNAEFHRRQIGAVRRALTVDDGSRAVTDNYLKVCIPPGRPRNEWINVEIAGSPGALEGIEAWPKHEPHGERKRLPLLSA